MGSTFNMISTSSVVVPFTSEPNPPHSFGEKNPAGIVTAWRSLVMAASHCWTAWSRWGPMAAGSGVTGKIVTLNASRRCGMTAKAYSL
jgi:hypothetical protein